MAPFDEELERITSAADPPMVIVTTRAGEERDGCLVGFSTQCSIEPVRLLVCLSKANRTYRIAERATTLVVHLLHDDPFDRTLAHVFGELTGDDVDKMARCQWGPGPGGVPVLVGCDWVAGDIVTKFDVGDHVAFVVQLTHADAPRAGEPWLGFQAVREFDAGHPADDVG